MLASGTDRWSGGANKIEEIPITYLGMIPPEMLSEIHDSISGDIVSVAAECEAAATAACSIYDSAESKKLAMA